MSITLELTEFELETVLKAFRNKADWDRAYRQMGLSSTLTNAVNQIEAQVATERKPIQRESAPGKKRSGPETNASQRDFL